MSPARMQTIVAQVQAKAGFVQEVKQACLALVEPSRLDRGCIVYDLYQSTEDATVFIFFERWESREDVDRHLETPHSLAFDEETAGMLAESEKITFLNKIS